MGPTRMVTSPELEPYNVYSYQSMHITGGAIMGTSRRLRHQPIWPGLGHAQRLRYRRCPLSAESGMNPTGTLLALAYLAGDAIRLLYLRDPGRVIAG